MNNKPIRTFNVMNFNSYQNDMMTRFQPNLLYTKHRAISDRTDKIQKIIDPTYKYAIQGSTDELIPEYNLEEIDRIEDTEQYVARAFRKKNALMFKEGFVVSGRNLVTIKYVEKRLQQIMFSSSNSLEKFLKRIGSDLIHYSNAFIAIVRDRNASGGQPTYDENGKVIEPIAGLFHIMAPTMLPKVDKHGNVKAWEQQIRYSGRTKKWNIEDIIHFTADHKGGYIYGTPITEAVKADIIALRRLEENIELLVHKSLFPLFHYKVGTETRPAKVLPDGTKEIDVVKQKIESMPHDGAIVTSERTTIEAIGSEGRALRVESYLDYFKKRVFAGLGISAVDMGEGDQATRSVADNMSRTLIDDVKFYQDDLECQLNDKLINILLREATFASTIDVFDPNNIVLFRFNEIDVDLRIKKENQATNNFNSNMIDHDEYRLDVGRQPMTEEQWKQTAWNLIDKPSQILKTSGDPNSVFTMEGAMTPGLEFDESEVKQSKQAYDKQLKQELQAKKAQGQTGRKLQKSKNSSAKASSHAANVTNARGNSKDSFIEYQIMDAVVQNVFSIIEDDIYNLILTSPDSTLYKGIPSAIKEKTINTFINQMKTRFIKGVQDVGINYTSLINSFSFINSELRDLAEQDVNRLFKSIIDRVNHVLHNTAIQDNVTIGDKLQSLKLAIHNLNYRARFIEDRLFSKSYNFGRALGLNSSGKKLEVVYYNIDSEFDSCPECQSHHKTKLDNVISIHTVPAWHPGCKCIVSEFKEE